MTRFAKKAANCPPSLKSRNRWPCLTGAPMARRAAAQMSRPDSCWTEISGSDTSALPLASRFSGRWRSPISLTSPLESRRNKDSCVQVLVRDNNIDQALKALKKKMQREGIFREMKLRGHYGKPCAAPANSRVRSCSVKDCCPQNLGQPRRDKNWQGPRMPQARLSDRHLPSSRLGNFIPFRWPNGDKVAEPRAGQVA